MSENTVLSTDQCYYRIEYEKQALRSFVLPPTCDFINLMDILPLDQTSAAIQHILRDYPHAIPIDFVHMEAEQERRRQEYQLLTHEEVLSLATLYERIQNWHTVKECIHFYYGEHARFVSITPGGPGDDVPLFYEVTDEQQLPCPLLDGYDEEDIWWEICTQRNMPEERAVYDLENPPSVQNRDPVIYTLIVEENVHVRSWEEPITSSAQAYQKQVWLQQIQTTIPTYFGEAAYAVETWLTPEGGIDVGVTDKDAHFLDFDSTLPWYDEWMHQQEASRLQELLLLDYGERRWKEFVPLLKRSLPMREATYILPALPILPELPRLYRRSDAPFLPELSEHPDVP